MNEIRQEWNNYHTQIIMGFACAILYFNILPYPMPTTITEGIIQWIIYMTCIATTLIIMDYTVIPQKQTSEAHFNWK